jgi:hypothetical protein
MELDWVHASNVHQAHPIIERKKKIQARRDRSTVPNNPKEITVKCHFLMSWVLARAFVAPGIRDATVGTHHARDRVRGATRLWRSRKVGT